MYFILHHLSQEYVPIPRTHGGDSSQDRMCPTLRPGHDASLVRSRRPLSSLCAASQGLVPWGAAIDRLPVKLRVGGKPTASPPRQPIPHGEGLNYLIGGGTLVGSRRASHRMQTRAFRFQTMASTRPRRTHAHGTPGRLVSG